MMIWTVTAINCCSFLCFCRMWESFISTKNQRSALKRTWRCSPDSSSEGLGSSKACSWGPWGQTAKTHKPQDNIISTTSLASLLMLYSTTLSNSASFKAEQLSSRDGTKLGQVKPKGASLRNLTIKDRPKIKNENDENTEIEKSRLLCNAPYSPPCCATK